MTLIDMSAKDLARYNCSLIGIKLISETLNLNSNVGQQLLLALMMDSPAIAGRSVSIRLFAKS